MLEKIVLNQEPLQKEEGKNFKFIYKLVIRIKRREEEDPLHHLLDLQDHPDQEEDPDNNKNNKRSLLEDPHHPVRVNQSNHNHPKALGI